MLNYQHKELANGRWFEFGLPEQLANVGSEIGRAIKWRNQKNEKRKNSAFFRGLELLSLTIDDPKNKLRLKELTRLYEVLGDYFIGENQFKSSDKLWDKYFSFFNCLARKPISH